MKSPRSPRKRTKNRPPIKHTKTFSGCWTCRDRHVKCDEARPDCTRCLKGGFECQGYGIRLVWVDSNTQEREQNIRRAIDTPALYETASLCSQIDVHEALEAIERLSTRRQSLSTGPFSVFALEQFTQACDEAVSEGETCPLPVNVGDSHDVVDFIEAEHSDDESIETIVSPSLSDTTTAFHDCNDVDLTFLDTLSGGFPPISRHLDLLPRPAEQRELIDHWTSFVCWHLVPVDRPDNPFRSVFTPMALAGLTLPSQESSGQIALFHAICATSAFSRGQLLNNDQQSLTLATKHYQLAIMHLRHSLARLKDNMDSEIQRGSVLATITAFSAMDMITGRSSEWRTHLQGGASWLATVEGSTWDRDKSSSMVYQGYVAIAALCNINLPSTVNVESEDCLSQKNYVLDRFFGLTRPILKHIVMMNSFIRKCFPTEEPGGAEALDEFELQLYEQTPESLDLEGLDPLSRALTRHHAYVFYYASLIYFQRAVRRRPPEEVQGLVELAVSRLEEIEDLGGDAIGCTLVWPPLVVACECLSEDLQQRILSWYKVKRRHGFRNLDISQDIAKELWRRRACASNEVDIQWQDVLKDLNMDIVLA
ncbi:hypothetical protein ABEF92_005952 [Exophiala dermatitidis]|uniref:Zn(2)-C6 fungal-type domain-containing protein n=1 Tax=Exophiala dermatitidis (strain ATCC 34100 / CBS 525.76 / NIH/UT8656) TaxID=858893 RepID=H6C0M0_EXODN|nr:uncharacterized protein HMPREF1120_05306 [Exophiala dermatitidis NIH/UT8656]EHY57262.1 hypothetical protein HMPREF1120_05306 [Exophiala dermatitidis NIH/UT8656]